MPRLRVIVLEQTPDDADTFQILYWADVPAARQVHYADANSPPTKKSVWPLATAGDNAAIANGSVAEQASFARVTPGAGMAAMQAFLQTRWQEYQDYINAYNPWKRTNSTWDGTTWDVKNNG